MKKIKRYVNIVFQVSKEESANWKQVPIVYVLKKVPEDFNIERIEECIAHICGGVVRSANLYLNEEITSENAFKAKGKLFVTNWTTNQSLPKKQIENLPLTLEQAKELQPGNIIYALSNRNADGSAQRWRVSGKTKTYKKDPKRISIPLKHGLYQYFTLTQRELYLFSLTEPERKLQKRKPVLLHELYPV